MKGKATISLYYSDIVRTKGGKPERNIKRDSTIETEYDSLDQLARLIQEAAETQHRLTGKAVLAQCFIWTHGQRCAIHFAYDIPE